MSFYTEYNLFTQEVGAYGIDNYLEIIEDELFLTAIRNTFIFVLGVVPVQIILSIAIAIMLNKIRYLSSFFRSIYFLPFVTSTVAISIVWRWLYHSNYGLVNWFLNLIGVGTISFLTDPEFGMLGLIVMSIWRGLGFNIILFLVGLTNINESYYQAAKIDGAKPFSRFLNITLPLLGPTIFLASVTGVINSFKVFDSVYALFDGTPGPGRSAVTMVYYIFRNFYEENNYTIATAAGVILFLIILCFTLVQMLINKKFVHYD